MIAHMFWVIAGTYVGAKVATKFVGDENNNTGEPSEVPVEMPDEETTE